MKHFIIIVTAIILSSCSSPSQNKTEDKHVGITEPLNQTENPLDFEEVRLTPCEPTALALDTITELQNQFYKPEEDMLDYKMIAAHVTNGPGEMGYVVFSKDNKLTICLIDWQAGYKIIGSTNIPNLKDKEQFVDLCESSCAGYFKTFGVVKEVKFGDVKTIRAWRVNDKTRQLEEIKPTAVNCRDSFYTDYD